MFTTRSTIATEVGFAVGAPRFEVAVIALGVAETGYSVTGATCRFIADGDERERGDATGARSITSGRTGASPGRMPAITAKSRSATNDRMNAPTARAPVAATAPR